VCSPAVSVATTASPPAASASAHKIQSAIWARAWSISLLGPHASANLAERPSVTPVHHVWLHLGPTWCCHVNVEYTFLSVLDTAYYLPKNSRAIRPYGPVLSASVPYSSCCLMISIDQLAPVFQFD
jgi:hypothetical protein